MKKLLFAINPHAGKGEIKTKALEVIDLFVHDGYEVTVHTTQRRREITHLLAGRAASYDLIVCCGGDGTLNETIVGLMRCTPRPPLGYIPAGTVNDLLQALGSPKIFYRRRIPFCKACPLPVTLARSARGIFPILPRSARLPMWRIRRRSNQKTCSAARRIFSKGSAACPQSILTI